MTTFEILLSGVVVISSVTGIGYFSIWMMMRYIATMSKNQLKALSRQGFDLQDIKERLEKIENFLWPSAHLKPKPSKDRKQQSSEVHPSV